MACLFHFDGMHNAFRSMLSVVVTGQAGRKVSFTFRGMSKGMMDFQPAFSVLWDALLPRTRSLWQMFRC